MLWKGFQKPKRLEVNPETLTATYGEFYAQPYERGFATTVGNTLRRVLLSSIEGAAITAVKIEDVVHEFSSVEGVTEDVTEMVLNLKTVPLRITDPEIDQVTVYLNAQIECGAQAVQIFDTWGGILTPRDYKEFSLQYMQRIVENLTKEHEGRKVPSIVFTKNGHCWIEDIANTGCDGVGLDWTVDIGDVRKRVGDRVALQGNMDPTVLYASPERIRKEVATILESYGKGPGHVFNLGHGIQQNVNPDNAGAFVSAVHELSKPYHRE